MLYRLMDHRRRVLFIRSGLVAGSASLYIWYEVWAASILLALGLLYLAVMLSMGALAHLNARAPLSLRWKITAAISLMLAILLGVSLVTLGAANSVHNEVHTIQELQETAPVPEISRAIQRMEGPNSELMRLVQSRFAVVPAALDRLENRQHLILTWIPVMIFGGGLVAVALGVALSASLLRPIGKISEGTSRIARGDFSQPVQVSNRDELGELATSLNNAAKDLGRLQEAILVEERARSLQARMAQAGLAQEKERQRISRELHDGLGPSLADLSNRLGVCRQLMRVDPLAAERELDEVMALLRGHLGEIRELINQLRPLALDQLGLVGALRQYVERFGEESGVEASLTVSDPLAMDPLTEVTIYRVVQESLTNVRKHARATTVQVALCVIDGQLEVKVSDNGLGFNIERAATSVAKGVGLASMRERAELVGGSFTVQSGPGQGSRTILRIPMKG